MQVIFVRENKSKTITLRISSKMIWGSVATLIIFLFVFFGFGAWSLFQFIPDFAKINIITQSKQDEELFNDIGVINGRIQALEEIVRELDGEKKIDKKNEKISFLNRNSSFVKVSLLKEKIDEIDSKVAMLTVKNISNLMNEDFMPNVSPINGRMTSSFGGRVHPISGRYHSHTGVDFAAPIGTNVHAIAGGVVIATYLSKYGLGKSIDIDHGGKYISRYAHLDGIIVKEGDLVSPGQKIARVGSTGSSTGPHLHLEIEIAKRKVDPVVFMKKFGRNSFEKNT